jgi:hypothetical protein
MKTMMTGDSKEELQLAVGGATTTQRWNKSTKHFYQHWIQL